MPDPNSFDDYMERFEALLGEAKSHGVAGVVVLTEHDPINDRNQYFYKSLSGLALDIGLAEWERNDD